MDISIIEPINETLSILDENVRAKIRTLYLEGKENKEIQAILGIPRGTWDNFYYLNRYDFRDFMDSCKRAYFLQETEKASRDFLAIKNDDSAKMQAIRQKEAEFVRETLLKDHGYTKRTENINMNIQREPLDDKQLATIDRILKKQKTQKPEAVKPDAETV
jgi:hypothetical protein